MASTFELIEGLFRVHGDTMKTDRIYGITYTRVSTKKQAVNNVSLETQLKGCIGMGEEKKIPIIREFGGTHESAKTDDRKEFEKAIEFAKDPANRVGYIIVYSFDRFSRSGRGGISIADELEKIGVHILSVTQPGDTATSSGKLLQTIQFAVGNYENEQRALKSLEGMKARLEQGYWPTTPPLGYTTTREHGKQKLIINATGEVIRQAFVWKNEGMSNHDISMKCRALGHEIDEKRLSVTFRNPFYCGILKHGIIPGKVFHGRHEPLVSEELFLKINQPETQPQNYISKPTDELFPLKRFIKCEKCGTHWVGYTVKAKNKNYYKCNLRGCKCNVSAERIQGEFKDFLTTYTIPEKYIEPLKLQISMTFKTMNEGADKDRVRLTRQLREWEEKLFKVEERNALGEIEDKAVYQRLKGSFQSEIVNIERELKKATTKLSNHENFVHNSVKLSSKLNTMWASGAFEVKQGLQNLLFPEGVYYDLEKRHYRTEKTNTVFARIIRQSGFWADWETKKASNFADFSHLVAPPRIELGSKV